MLLRLRVKSSRGYLHDEVFDVSSDWEIDPNIDQTRTWTDPFDSQISDIEHYDEDIPSPATTILDVESDLHLSDNDHASEDVNRGQKRKNISPESNSSYHQQESGDELRCSTDQSNIRMGYDGFHLRSFPEVLGDRTGIQSSSIYKIGDDTKHDEHSVNDPFGFNHSRATNWSISSDPIERCTDDELNCSLSGGGAPAAEFSTEQDRHQQACAKNSKMSNMVTRRNKFACC